MKYYNIIRIFIVALVGFFGCKNEKVDLNKIDNSIESEFSHKIPFTPEYFDIPFPDSIYQPKHLIKMNLLEIYKYTQDIIGNITIKNYKGEFLDSTTRSSKVSGMFMNFYKDDKGQPIEAVAFNMTPEIIDFVLKEKKNRQLLTVPTPQDAYEPKNLRKLDVFEMIKSIESGDVNMDYICKTPSGKTVNKDYLSYAGEMRFAQMFVDDKDIIKEVVIYNMTDELKTILIMTRVLTKR